MSWLVLVVSGVLEAVWATALGRSEGLSRLVPSVVFAVALVLSMVGLAYAMRELPVGTSYAVWVGIGASLTVVYAMATGTEPVSLVKVRGRAQAGALTGLTPLITVEWLLATPTGPPPADDDQPAGASLGTGRRRYSGGASLRG
jgi:quaternary ammonium compound-resistance protein SugE